MWPLIASVYYLDLQGPRGPPGSAGHKGDIGDLVSEGETVKAGLITPFQQLTQFTLTTVLLLHLDGAALARNA